MKKSVYILALTCLAGTFALVAQDKKKKEEPKTWPEKAAQRFGDKPTAEQKKQIEEAIPKATAKPKKDRKVLVFWRCEGFIHTSIPFGNHAMSAISQQTDAFEATLAHEYKVFTKENLEQYDAIIFNNTTHLKPNEEQQAAILDFVNGGKGIVGFHAAADNFGKSGDYPGWDEGIAMIGGIFNGHPWGAGGTWAFKLDDPDHVLNAAFKEKGFWHRDEIYWYKPENFQGRDKLRILLSLDMSKAANTKPLENDRNKGKVKGEIKDVDVAVSWVREIGKGRLFFTNLGHNDVTFADTTILQHMLDGIQYAMGDIDADAKPSSEVKGEAALAPEEAPK